MNDLYNVTEEYNFILYQDQIVAVQWNSDGAGAYELAFVIKDGKVIQRLAGTIY